MYFHSLYHNTHTYTTYRSDEVVELQRQLAQEREKIMNIATLLLQANSIISPTLAGGEGGMSSFLLKLQGKWFSIQQQQLLLPYYDTRYSYTLQLLILSLLLACSFLLMFSCVFCGMRAIML